MPLDRRGVGDREDGARSPDGAARRQTSRIRVGGEPRIRYAGSSCHADQAHQMLNQVKVLKPHMAEASLLEAEMDAAEGKSLDAKQILNILYADLNTPDWVRESALTLSNKIP